MYKRIASCITWIPSYGGMTTSRKSGFTLIELSIVLVIIGLLVGGVLVGRDLIKSAEIRSQISQIEKFKVATNTFKLKYGSLPGDIPPDQAAANSFFEFTGTQKGKSVTNGAYGFGDNNGRIAPSESYVFWQHLSEAKFIEGQFGGTPSGDHINANTDSVQPWLVGYPFDLSNAVLPLNTPARNDMFLPRQKLTSTIYNIYVGSTMADNTTTSINNHKSFNNYFYVYGTPNEAYAIDSKIDDGNPLAGAVIEMYSDWLGATQPCTTTDISGTVIYDLNPTKADTIDPNGAWSGGGCDTIFLW